MRLARLARPLIRLFSLLAAIVAALDLFENDFLLRFFPSCNPVLVLLSIVATRARVGVGFWFLPPIFFLLLAYWRGPVFCRYLCPLGTLQAIIATLRKTRDTVLTQCWGSWLLWIGLFGALAGVPLWSAIGPLDLFGRLIVAISLGLEGRADAALLALGLVTIGIVGLSFFQPLLWCSRICPVGYVFRKLYRLRLERKIDFDPIRRELLVGAMVGLGIGSLLRRGSDKAPPLLPPGATTPTEFAALCTRCYACVQVCPTGVIRVRWDSSRSLMQWFQPELDTRLAYCDEFCTRCSQVCSSGALQPLDPLMKHRRQIGVAQISRHACLAWAEGESCMACHEYCPYHAIRVHPSEKGIPCPVIDPERCRGCGCCEVACPAIRDGKAIRILGVPRQRDLANI